jgi:hypothetical protein
MGTVVVLADIEPVPGPDAALAARLCAAINARGPQPPLTIVAAGALARHLPAVALSQRSNHRTVERYVLVDPELPAVTDSWPDAPVTLVSDDDWLSMQGRLRGWDVRGSGDYDGPGAL